MGIEPMSSAWKAEVLPLNYTRRCTAPADLKPVPFSLHLEPVVWWRGKDSNLRRRKPADLQSAPVGRLGTPPRKRAAYSDFGAAGCQCILARKLLAQAPPTRHLAREVSLKREASPVKTCLGPSEVPEAVGLPLRLILVSRYLGLPWARCVDR
jgi:hypothetical protein